MNNEFERTNNTELSPGEKFYTKEVAENYEKLRKADRYWSWENKILMHCLEKYSINGKVADCPLGTGRFLDIYLMHELNILGIDISPNMLRIAREKVDNSYLKDRVELIQADASELSFDNPISNSLVCFRLLHLISCRRLNDVVRGLAAIPSEYIFLQVFLLKDFDFRRVMQRLFYAICSREINFVSKLKYIYRTLRSSVAYSLGYNKPNSTAKHELNTLCDVTYSHHLSSVLKAFRANDFTMIDSFDLKDTDHLMRESGCSISMVLVMKKVSLAAL